MMSQLSQPKMSKSAKRRAKFERSIMRQASAIQGQGPYGLEDIGQAFARNKRAIAPLIGAGMGFAAGGPAGVIPGIAAGTAFNKAAGWGDYAV